jgi:cyanuric acid amidohydrolase
VREAIKRAAIADDADVHWVQVKCPLLTKERIADAASRGEITATDDPYASMGLSRAAAALGVALALGEVDPAMLNDRAIGHDFDLWSTRASASAGIELMHNEVIVLGNSAAWSSDSVIAHGVMRDAIDLPNVIDVLRRLDFTIAAQLDEVAATRVLAVLAKAEASRSGTIRGARHIMSDDSDIQASRHARAGRRRARRRHRPHRPVRLGRRRAPGTRRRWTHRSDRPPSLLNSGTLARQLLAPDQR